MPKKYHRPSVTVDEAATMLRINKHTLYRAVRRGEVPTVRIGRYVRIPVTFLGLEPPEVSTPTLSSVARVGESRYGDQLEFDLHPIPQQVRTWRNTGKPVRTWDYERARYRF